MFVQQHLLSEDYHGEYYPSIIRHYRFDEETNGLMKYICEAVYSFDKMPYLLCVRS